MTDHGKIRCGKCTMEFSVAERAKGGNAEYARCPEKGCGLRFWSADQPPAYAIRVGVDPADVPHGMEEVKS